MKTTYPETEAKPNAGPDAGRGAENPFPTLAASAAAAEPGPRNLLRTVRGDNICTLTFDRPGSAANIFDVKTLTELDEELAWIEASPDLKGVVLASAKRSIFLAGVDLHMMTRDASLDDVRKLIELGQRVMSRLAALPIPTVAAIHGVAVGGG